MQRQSRFAKRPRPVAKNCNFCATHAEPDYKNTPTLNRYLSDRAKIIGRSRSGVCSKHQRRLTRAIKQARHVALLPFVSRAY